MPELMVDVPGLPMTPAQHYLEAERLLELADERVSANWPTQTGETKADIIAMAQVHATLACTTGAYADAYARAKGHRR